MTVFNCNVCCSSFSVSGHKTLDDDDDDGSPSFYSVVGKISYSYHLLYTSEFVEICDLLIT